MNFRPQSRALCRHFFGIGVILLGGMSGTLGCALTPYEGLGEAPRGASKPPPPDDDAEEALDAGPGKPIPAAALAPTPPPLKKPEPPPRKELPPMEPHGNLPREPRR